MGHSALGELEAVYIQNRKKTAVLNLPAFNFALTSYSVLVVRFLSNFHEEETLCLYFILKHKILSQINIFLIRQAIENKKYLFE